MWSKHPLWLVLLLACAVGVLTLGASVAVDWFLHGRGVVEEWVLTERIHIYASDLLAAIVAALASGMAFLRVQVQRRELLARMQAIEDVNHHVRNALTAAVFASALHDDEDLQRHLRDATERIDWALREVLPQTLRPTRAGAQAGSPHWTQGRRLKRDAS